MVERLHRQLKTALTTRLNRATWVDALPLVLLGLRAVIRAVLNSRAGVRHFSTASGRLLHVNEATRPATTIPTTPPRLLSRPPAHSTQTFRFRNKTIFVHPDLATATHVFVRHDALRPPLTQACDGPFRVLNRTPKTATLLQNGREETVSLDRLKPAYLETAIENLSSTPDLPVDYHKRHYDGMSHSGFQSTRGAL
ncbi:uncharacterized protein LOC119382257 [Rhipicephalus sanguineus]|uniref:uncharacterized protein LOC119382256 n=1 Tax=Rhipicephalus sanguineus TaxID=34632 RepID=UPI001893DC0B|nr:uncharacterized protein LOC119382256 [Rhipicephalus sanguineus]XP_037505894.1 uncharacterized protein LOC119382257 [Rhipicephalus sanguineus]